MIKLIIFDLDGVLIDSRDLHYHALNNALDVSKKKISNVKISNDSKEFEKYLSLSRSRIVNDLYNTYDDYLKKKYKIDINYQGLDLVKNYFN